MYNYYVKNEYTISWRTIIRLIITGVSIFLVWKLASIILMVIIAMMLASAFHPFVSRLQKWMPVTVASVVVVSFLLLPIFLIAFTFIPNLVAQFPEILKILNNVLSHSSVLPPALKNIDLSSYEQNIGSYLLKSTSIFTNFVASFAKITFLTLYFLIDSRRLTKILVTLVPDAKEKKLLELVENVNEINGHYIRGNLFISLLCGLIIFTGLFFLKVPFAAPLALFTAITDLLPLVGAIGGLLPAGVIAFSVSPALGISVLILYLVYQEFENHVLGPNVYNKQLDLSPALCFIAVLCGASLFGMMGAFISLPIAASLPTIISYIRSNPLQE